MWPVSYSFSVLTSKITALFWRSSGKRILAFLKRINENFSEVGFHQIRNNSQIHFILGFRMIIKRTFLHLSRYYTKEHILNVK